MSQTDEERNQLLRNIQKELELVKGGLFIMTEVLKDIKILLEKKKK